MQIIRADSEHIDALAILFDQYRVFYKASSDPEAARKFLQERFQKKDSVIFLGFHESNSAGFVQLYPSFSSVSMQPIWILNDLFVEKSYRRLGLAQLLMEKAECYARETGAIRITLATQMSNHSAQELYISRGYIKDAEFFHYSLSL